MKSTCGGFMFVLVETFNLEHNYFVVTCRALTHLAHQPVVLDSGLLKDISIGAGGPGIRLRPDQISRVSPTARHRCDVSLELYCPGAKPRRWIPPLVTHFRVKTRVGCCIMKILILNCK